MRGTTSTSPWIERHSRSDAGLGFAAKVWKTYKVVSIALGSGTDHIGGVPLERSLGQGHLALRCGLPPLAPTRDSYSRKATMERVLMAPRTDRTTCIPSGVESPVTTTHAAKGSVFVNVRNTRKQKNGRAWYHIGDVSLERSLRQIHLALRRGLPPHTTRSRHLAQSNLIFIRVLPNLDENAHTMAPRTSRRLQE